MAKSISVKAGSFNAITVEKFSRVTAVVCGVRMNWARVLFNTLKKMVTPGSKQAKGFAVQISLLLENIPNLELGESSEFPASKILTENTVHRYVSLNAKGGAKEAADAPLVKNAPKKSPAAAEFEAPVIKNKRTMKKKSSSFKAVLEIVAVAQEAVPIQMIEPTKTSSKDEISADPPADEVAGETADVEAADEGSNEEPAAGDATRINEPTSEPAVTDVDEGEKVVRTLGEGNQPAGTAKEPHWFDLPYDDLIARWDAERPVVTASDTVEDVETMDVGAAGGDQQNNFVPGKGSSAIDLKVRDMLSDIHLFVLEELREQAVAHSLKWTRTCCSKIVEGSPRDRGAIIARTNTNTPSTCYLRKMIRVDGVWVVEPFCDQWVKIPRPVVCTEVSRQCSFVDFFLVGPQPPPAVQIRDSGNAGGSGDSMRTTEITQTDIY
ncbi:nucleolar protein 8 [Dorcoceras hygrometricum]|uniref:Nucleolar protein 8 n=1 Tax=Dorcoceras hygrometricum TaxID=472368 RepID=A0A2Z7CZF4_9LAMI|nr:nucleolar protein 8 [Dorcoceras hygrometricum]